MPPSNCFIPPRTLDKFTEYARGHGYEVRPHTNLFINGIQIKSGPHWMAVVWNKSWARYTVDIRLKDLVNKFTNSIQPVL